MRLLPAVLFSAAVAFAAAAAAAPTDDIADALLAAGNKTPITAESLPDDFARLSRFVRHDTGGMAIFSDGGPTDGYVRHAQARFDLSAMPRGGPNATLFTVAFELASQSDFTFEAFAAALETRLGTPSASSNQTGNSFRMWRLKQVDGRTLTVAKSQASDNGDPVTIVSLTQQR